MISTPSFSTWMTLGRLVGDHLWQSTLFAAIAGLLTMAFRNHRAEVRNGLWLAASVKFLIPFVALSAVGSLFSWRHGLPVAQSSAPFFVDLDAASQPFSSLAAAAPPAVVTHSLASTVPIFLFAIWLCGCAAILLTWWTHWRRVAIVVRKASHVDHGPQLDGLRRIEAIFGIRKAVALASSNTSLEPGVFGIASPVLLWPRSIADHLTDAQAEMIFAHELSHVRRRDNLAAALHMMVEAIFWFYPLVWWLGTRMVDERERACDEDVLRLGGKPQVYAESVLKVCELYLASPIVCMSGVTSSNLKKRMERIMSNRVGQDLNAWRKMLLVTAGFAALAVPVMVGVLAAPRQLAAQTVPDWQKAAGGKMAFEVASVTPNKEAGRPISNVPLTLDDNYAPTGGRLAATDNTLRAFMWFAYKTQQIPVGFPDWGSKDRFDIEATAQGNPTKDQFRLMMQSLLADRFKLAAHFETRQIPIFALVLSKEGRTGPQLRPDEGQCTPITPGEIQAGNSAPRTLPPPSISGSQPTQIPCGTLVPVPPSAPGRMRIAGTKVPMALLVRMMTNPASGVDRPVLDHSGLNGTFDVSIEWTPAITPPPGSNFTPDQGGPTFFEAIQEQLGLKLQPQTGPVNVLVIDHVEKPSSN